MERASQKEISTQLSVVRNERLPENSKRILATTIRVTSHRESMVGISAFCRRAFTRLPEGHVKIMKEEAEYFRVLL